MWMSVCILLPELSPHISESGGKGVPFVRNKMCECVNLDRCWLIHSGELSSANSRQWCRYKYLNYRFCQLFPDSLSLTQIPCRVGKRCKCPKPVHSYCDNCISIVHLMRFEWQGYNKPILSGTFVDYLNALGRPTFGGVFLLSVNW